MRRTITNEIWEQIKTAYASGLGLREIARNTGIPEGTVLAGVSERGVGHIETMDGPEILKAVDEIETLDKVARRTFGLSDGDSHGNNVIVDVALLGIDPASVRADQPDS